MNHVNPKTIVIMSKLILPPIALPGLQDISATVTCAGCVDGKQATRPQKQTANVSEEGKSLWPDVRRRIQPTIKQKKNNFQSLIDRRKRYVYGSTAWTTARKYPKSNYQNEGGSIC